MPVSHRVRRSLALFLFAVGAGTRPASAQTGDEVFVSGLAAQAWTYWQTGLESILSRDNEAAEAAFGQLVALETSPLRLALLAERTAERTRSGGALLMLEQDAAAGALGEMAQKVYDALEVGKEQLNQADDGWYFASIGRFGVSKANFEALLASSPDPVALLEFADRAARRHEILIQLSDHAELGVVAKGVLRLLAEGERLLNADPIRIRQNVDRLGGPPRAFENGVAYLRESGEYSVPFLLQALRDRERTDLAQPVSRALALVGRSGLNPLVMALRTDEPSVQAQVLAALGEIGYWQAVPYLLALRENKDTPPAARTLVEQTLSELSRRGVRVDSGIGAAQAFLRLAEQYYDNAESVAADSRYATTSVWYWRDDLVQNVEVPTPIFNEVMCMRCCEEALRIDPNLKPALALWVAANIRREAQLPAGAVDDTRPENFAPAAFFAQSSGAESCLMALARGLEDGEPVVALGAIEALRRTAGRAALTGGLDGKHPLAEALSFPDRLVRIRAALALGAALPTDPFPNAQNLMPVLSDALRIHSGSRSALVSDPDESAANEAAAVLRGLGFDVVVEANLLTGLQKVRSQTAGADVFVLGSDISANLSEAIAQIRSENRFAQTPILLVARPYDARLVRDLVRSDHRLSEYVPGATPEAVQAILDQAARATGALPITPELGSELALEAAMVLREIALTDNPLFKVGEAEPALLIALQGSELTLRAAVAGVLGYVGTPSAQDAVAALALDESGEEALRLTMFTALAEAARRTGNHLSGDQVAALTRIAENETNPAIRTAASEALGALNLPGNPASAIVRNQYRG